MSARDDFKTTPNNHWICSYWWSQEWQDNSFEPPEQDFNSQDQTESQDQVHWSQYTMTFETKSSEIETKRFRGQQDWYLVIALEL